MNKRLYPQDMIYQGRKVKCIVCEENEEERKIRIGQMLKASNHNRMAVVSTDKDGNQKIYSSMTEAGKLLDICPSYISACCRTGNKAKEKTWQKLNNMVQE